MRAIAVVLFVALMTVGSALAQTPPTPSLSYAVNEDFEDGQYSGTATKMEVPPKIVEEDGNRFLRITGSGEDKESIPSQYPNRNRSTIFFTSPPKSMPVLNDSNRRQTYSADLRVTPDNMTAPSFHASIFELYQWADGETETYGQRNGIGPTARFLWTNPNGGVFDNYYNNETERDRYRFSATPGKWHRYTANAVWSNDPNVGRIEIYLDGKLLNVFTGKPTNLGPNSNRLPALKFGLYGDFATGTLDVDNV